MGTELTLKRSSSYRAAQLYDYSTTHLDTWLSDILRRRAWDEPHFIIAYVCATRMAIEHKHNLFQVHDGQLEYLKCGPLFSEICRLIRSPGGKTYQLLNAQQGVDPIQPLLEYCLYYAYWTV